jgi:hypothetical protein
MAMISAAQAQQLLGCDEATLSNHINNGTIRSQRMNGELMVEEDDVRALSGGLTGDSESDSILVLDGETEDLSIDLGEVVDDGAATLVEPSGGMTPGSKHGTDQITFGDELEVVSFDDGSDNTQRLDLPADDTEATIAFDDLANTENLSFTEGNTAVLTDVDDTMTATATSDYQTVEDADFGDDDVGPAAGSIRRSVRSERVRPAPVKTSPIWPIILILTLLVNGALIAPYYFVGLWPKEGGITYFNGDKAYGIDDNAWANIAGTFVGFDVEPDADKWRRTHPDGEAHRTLASAFPDQPSDPWRYKEYRGRYDDEGVRAMDFYISEVDMVEEADGSRRPENGRSKNSAGATLVEFPFNEESGGDEGAPKEFVPIIRY